MTEIPKAYEPQSVEDKWYDFWVRQGCFTADPARVSAQRPAYSIVIPPPNVTGMLHMGHVLNNTIQDILSRKARMDGKEVLWLPGTDHAGIATQVQVEKALKKEEKKTKHDLGREEFLKRVWQWKDEKGGIIINQLKKLGCSCDWTRERFTMDPEYSRCVQKVFVELYKKGLIYRGKRMVNWCPATQTALSDEEVEMKPQKGFMYHFKVEVAEAPGTWLTIATTRPETIPGDTAVAVNPKDPRYAHLIGKHIVRPLPAELPREQKLIPIIGDEHVDFEFGTGVLKVTPAHDKADFDIGSRHKLPIVDIMNPDGTMNDLAGADLRGLERFKARKLASEKLAEQGVLVEEKPYENNVGFSQRADVPIEPRLSEQWFLKYPSVEVSKVCVADGQMKFHPDRWAKVYDHWLSNIQDWCISRQLWWGHRVPVWYRGEEVKCQIESPGAGWIQDPDVLDTWFSSWLWPFATMGWTGDKASDANAQTLRAFYPTTDLVTGPDIIFFWVA
ncbi:MAG: valine--tRNA ligase, partial [Pedosphaera sp. Tous-C6FEB]